MKSDYLSSPENTLQYYCRFFLDPAHRYRFWKEYCCIPRIKDYCQVNTNDEIAIGKRFRTFYPDTRRESEEYFSLVNMKWKLHRPSGSARGDYGRLRYTIKLKDNALHKCWILTSYEDHREISFLMFDLDRHHRDETSQVRCAIDDCFWNNVRRLQNLSNEYGFTIMWTTSPGDEVDGQHVQGLYAWIKLSTPILVGDLRRLTSHWVELHSLRNVDGYNLEFNTDTSNRPIRLPGQRYVELAIVDSNKRRFITIEPDIPKHKKKVNINERRFALVLESWANLESVDPARLFEKTEKISRRQQSRKSSPVVPSIPYINHKYADGHTFTTICQTAGALVRSHQGRRDKRDDIIRGVKAQVILRHGQGNTCSDPDILHKKVSREVDRLLDSYKPLDKKAVALRRNRKAKQRELIDQADKIKIDPIRHITSGQLSTLLLKMEVSERTTLFMTKWLVAANSQNGRVAVKRRAASDQGVTMIELAGNERRYPQVASEIKQWGLWNVLEDHNHFLHICSQITLSQKVIDGVGRLNELNNND